MADSPTGPDLLRDALGGDPSGLRALVEHLTPIVHVRVARALLRGASGRRQGRDLRQEIEDFVQEVFTALFANDARTLRAWDPTRGMSLVNYVGLVAEHQAASILRSGRRSPWKEEATSSDSLERDAGTSEGADRRVHSREVLARLVARLGEELSPRGFQLFQLIVVEERSVEEVCKETAMTADAVYAWRSRLGKLARKIHEEIMNGSPFG